MARLSGCVDDGIRADFCDEIDHSLPIPNINFMMNEAGKLGRKTLLVPPRVTLRTEEDGTLVVIDAVDLITEFIGEVLADLGTDEARGTGNEEFFSHKIKLPVEG